MDGVTPRIRLFLTPVLKLVIAVAGLLILQALVPALPMVREIPIPLLVLAEDSSSVSFRMGDSKSPCGGFSRYVTVVGDVPDTIDLSQQITAESYPSGEHV